MTTAEDLARSSRSFLIAPAGTGKTELIARAVSLAGPSARQLVLTHTHAGVHALRRRLNSFGVGRSSYRVDTIAGFCLRFASAFPVTSGLAQRQPRGQAWSAVYRQALAVFERSFSREILASTYDGLYVDEYQDCTAQQHAVILRLAECIPTRLLGDPLQGVFGFAGTLVDWSSLASDEFEELPSLSTPWRWGRSNPELGEWLIRARERIESGQTLDLRDGPIEVAPSSEVAERLAADRMAEAGGTMAAIFKWPDDAHGFALGMGGSYQSMEEMECRDLFRLGGEIAGSSGLERARAVAVAMSTAISGLEPAFELMADWVDVGFPSEGHPALENRLCAALINVSSDDSWEAVSHALRVALGAPSTACFRRELLQELVACADQLAHDAGIAFAEVAWDRRDQARKTIRRLDDRIASRVLLVKGLEFDHVLVAAADMLNRHELYVALTRGSCSLSVLSEDGESVTPTR